MRRVAALGMPETVIGGLSETWLLEQCGDIHWQLLAQLFGTAPTALRDAEGNRVYTGIVACELRGEPGLASLGEGMDLTLTGRLLGLRGAASVAAIDVASSTPGVVAHVDVLARFVRRKAATNVGIVGSPPVAVSGRSFGAVDETPIYRRHRQELVARRKLTSLPSGDHPHERSFRPCPTLDFNGADLLYFAKYHTFVERTEWELGAIFERPSAGLVARDTYYFGNLDPGDELRVQLDELSCDGIQVGHRARLFRCSDQLVIATVRTSKRAVGKNIV